MTTETIETTGRTVEQVQKELNEAAHKLGVVSFQAKINETVINQTIMAMDKLNQEALKFQAPVAPVKLDA